jgi:thymidylate synthase (FAD)
MILVKPSFEIMAVSINPLLLIELAGRTCYKSEDKITDNSAKTFVEMVTKRGHHSVIEHAFATVKIICDRGVTHEIVRHRLASYSQESTRYCNYKGGVTFVIPPWVGIVEGEYIGLPSSDEQVRYGEASCWWWNSVFHAERNYKYLLNTGWSPQQARSVLPNSTKTEIVITANVREWRHIFTLRCSKAAHPQMREIMIPLHQEMKIQIPVIFDDIKY